jgi:hypothetical protein
VFELLLYCRDGRRGFGKAGSDGVRDMSWIVLEDPTLFGAGEDCFRGLYYEVSLALVGVASPAYFQ